MPAKNEAGYLGRTLRSIRNLEPACPSVTIVVDGDSNDGTPAVAREHGATVLEHRETGIAQARNQGVERARGQWLAFVDADTRLHPQYLSTMVDWLESRDLAAGSTYCRVVGPSRAKALEMTIDYVFSRLSRSILPGFNTMVHRSAFDAVGGFPEVGNEDTAFSRTLGRHAPSGYCPEALVETSGRRVADRGLTGTFVHYSKLGLERVRATY